MLDMLRQCGRPEMVVGWYHSHPGFGCWLSGVDVNTSQVRRLVWFGLGFDLELWSIARALDRCPRARRIYTSSFSNQPSPRPGL